MKKPILYFLAGVLCAIVGLFVLSAAGFIIQDTLFFGVGDGGADFNVISTSPSPDGKYFATVYRGMGGGAAGWCSIRVSVDPETEPFSIERQKTDGKPVVFNITCNSEVEAKWESERELLVTFRGPKDESGFSVYKAPVDWSRQVKVKYLERD